MTPPLGSHPGGERLGFGELFRALENPWHNFWVDSARKKKKKIRSLYVVGNSYSSTSPESAHAMWPGELSRLLGFPFIQARNAAQPSASLFTTTFPLARPGLVDQLKSLPAGPKKHALLVIWIFPPTIGNGILPIEEATYTRGIDLAYARGFRIVLMPNLPDPSGLPYAQEVYTPEQLAIIRGNWAQFNAEYAAMIKRFKKRHPEMAFGSVDIFSRWDGSGTVDGLHPGAETHRVFAQWFKARARKLARRR
jgi:hypothetical protein